MPSRLDLPTEDLCRLYVEEKLSSSQIAERYHCSASAVYKKLREMGVEMRPRGHLPLELPDDEIVRLYTEEKLGSSAIAKRFGVNTQTILQRLEKHGVVRRRKGRP